MPYPTEKPRPRSPKASMRRSGTAEPPQVRRCRLLMSARSQWGCSCSIWKVVGTPASIVMRSHSMVSST